MSAGVCGKRVGFEEIFGASSPTSAKRSRCSSYGSPIRSGSEDPVSVLLQMFPNLDPEVVKSALRDQDNKIEDAIVSLRALSFGDMSERTKALGLDSTTIGNCSALLCESRVTSSQMSEDNVGNINTVCDGENIMDGPKWVDLFVHEMMNATDLDDARGRAARILEAFETSITANSKISEEHEHASLKEHLQSLLNDNQILKRAVAIQHERHLEQEEKDKEVQHLKLVIGQYQQEVRKLEMNNYALKVHLQRAQESSSIPGRFHPDIY
ncbi:uncharacterized protein LOC123202041 isoform X2 [Mangifera indica]|uniref:uncharacterized protein LOC123202041 isoform X2 n=1 Tax=Mangifera indica TaxID=29780 RepID=UPI001CFBDB4E|nr:uncharacterized protein LOC123202041 isoform X2 [Mangifera indica]